MENKDSSIFSGPGNAIFSEINTSEVPMGNPNTEDEKKSTIEQENQEIKRNQSKMGSNILNSELNPLEKKNEFGIGDVGKIQLEKIPSALENLEGCPVLRKPDVSKEEKATISQNSGLDDSISENQGEKKPKTQRKATNRALTLHSN